MKSYPCSYGGSLGIPRLSHANPTISNAAVNSLDVSNNVHGYNSPNPIRSPVMCECVFPTMVWNINKTGFCLTSMLLRLSLTGRFKHSYELYKCTITVPETNSFRTAKKGGYFPDDKNLAVNTPIHPTVSWNVSSPPVMSSLTTSIGHCTSSKLGKTATNSSDAHGI